MARPEERQFLNVLRRRLTSPTLTVVLLGAVVFLALINITGLRLYGGPFDPDKFGTVGAWFSGIAAVSAIIIAWLSFAHEREVAERARAESDPAAAARREASRVYAWVEFERDPSRSIVRGRAVIVHNDTPVPIYKWLIKNPGGMTIVSSDSDGPLLPGRNSVRVGRPELLTADERTQVSIMFLARNSEWLQRDIAGDVAVVTDSNDEFS